MYTKALFRSLGKDVCRLKVLSPLQVGENNNPGKAVPRGWRLIQKTWFSTSAGTAESKSRVEGGDSHPERTTPGSTKLLSMADMPGPRNYPIVGTASLKALDVKQIVPLFRARAIEFFPHGLYKEKLVGNEIVVLLSAEAIEKFFRNEAKYPNRFGLPLWDDYRQVSGEEMGVFTGLDEQWHRMRSVVDKPMLRLKDVKSYSDELNQVVTDLLARLERIKRDDAVIPHLEQELFNWSLESIGTVLYERRFGGLSDHRDPEMEAFIAAVGQMFLLTIELFMFPIWMVKTLRRKKYNEHKQAWDILFTTAKKCVDERMAEIEGQLKRGEEVQGVLAYLLAQDSMTIREVYANVTELMMAAVDTTSNTVLWCLHEISQKPEVQEKIFAEVKGCVGESIPSYQDLQNMPYMKAVIKETLRMYPAAGSVSRIIEEDLELCGYHVPAKVGEPITGCPWELERVRTSAKTETGITERLPLSKEAYLKDDTNVYFIVVDETVVSVTLFAVSRLPQYFDDPDEFVPERWLRDRAHRPNPFTSIPFGVGTRMCVGRRVAELEMHLLLSRLVQGYRIEPAFTEPAQISMTLVLKPDRPIRVRLIPRGTD